MSADKGGVQQALNEEPHLTQIDTLGFVETRRNDTKRPRKKVAFHTDTETASNSTISSSDTVTEDITNLCSIIARSIRSTSWPGALSNKQGRRYRVRAVQQQTVLSTAGENVRTASLAYHLNNNLFRREQRSRLGLKLASSVMQLHTTQWLLDTWGKNDVLFLQAVDGTVQFNSPLIRRSFGSGTKQLFPPELKNPASN